MKTNVRRGQLPKLAAKKTSPNPSFNELELEVSKKMQ